MTPVMKLRILFFSKSLFRYVYNILFVMLPAIPLLPLPEGHFLSSILVCLPVLTLLKAMLVKPEEKTCSCKLHLAEHCVSADFTLAHDLGVLTQLRRLRRDDDTLDLTLLTELNFAF